MTLAIEAAKRGECDFCGAKTHHGPWSDEQIAEAVADMGIEPAEFGDTCDQCFVDEVGRGDLAYAQSLSRHPLNARGKPTGIFALLALPTQGTPMTQDPSREALEKWFVNISKQKIPECRKL